MVRVGSTPSISVVVPVFNEEGNVGPLVEAVRSALAGEDAWELVLVDDGSSDATASRAREAAASDPRVRLVRLAANFGQTPAIQAGFEHARGRVVVTMDGDLQNDPLDIPSLLEKLDEGYDLVAGYRVDRKDAALKRKLPSWVANRIIRRITGVSIRDNGCSLKAYRADLLQRMHLYSDMHRFIPAVAAGTAGARIAEVPVRHHPRLHGASKYGLTRVAKVLADLLTILMVRSFRERPLMLFGAAALVSMAVALVILAIMIVAASGPVGVPGYVLPGTALLFVFLTTYLLLVGLVSEIAVAEMRDASAGDILLREVV